MKSTKCIIFDLQIKYKQLKKRELFTLKLFPYHNIVAFNIRIMILQCIQCFNQHPKGKRLMFFMISTSLTNIRILILRLMLKCKLQSRKILQINRNLLIFSIILYFINKNRTKIKKKKNKEIHYKKKIIKFQTKTLFNC